MDRTSRQIDAPDVLKRVMDDAAFDTQADFAAAIGMSPGQVNRWLTGAANPPERRLRMAIEQVGLLPEDYGLRPSRARLAAVAQPVLDAGPSAEPPWARDLGRKLDHIIDLLEHRR